jgi:hypothetical protein
MKHPRAGCARLEETRMRVRVLVGGVIAVASVAACGGLSTGEPILPGDGGTEAAPSGVVCGSGQAACGGTCVSGRCLETLASVDGNGIAAIAVDDTSVYWTGDAVMRVSKTGGAPVTLANDPTSFAIAVDATGVYWTSNDRAVVKVSPGGGPSTTLASWPFAEGSSSSWTSIAVSNGSVCWTHRPNLPYDGVVARVSVSGGTTTTLATSQMAPISIAVHADTVVWSDEDQGVMSAPVIGGTPTTLVAKETSLAPVGIAVDSTSVYFSDLNNVLKVPLRGGTPRTLAAGYGIEVIATDETNVYWVAPNDGAIVSVPLNGGTATALVQDRHFGIGVGDVLAVDSTSLYWAEGPKVPGQNLSTIMKLTPK